MVSVPNLRESCGRASVVFGWPNCNGVVVGCITEIMQQSLRLRVTTMITAIEYWQSNVFGQPLYQKAIDLSSQVRLMVTKMLICFAIL